MFIELWELWRLSAFETEFSPPCHLMLARRSSSCGGIVPTIFQWCWRLENRALGPSRRLLPLCHNLA